VATQIEFFRAPIFELLVKQLQIRGQYAARIGLYLALSLLAFQSAKLFWRLVPEPSVNSLPAPVTSKRNVAPIRAELPTIGSLHLFGEIQAINQPIKVPTQAPKTNLQLTLRGLFHTDGDHAPLAIIAEGNKPEQVFHVGDSIASNAEIYSIETDRVILKRGARYETLFLPKQTIEIQRTPTSLASARNSASLSMRDTGSLSSIRDQLLSNPQHIQKWLKVAPYFKNQKVSGYRITPGPDSTLMDSLGLESGDIVLSINGHPLGDAATMLKSLQSLANANTVLLEVNRSGNTITLQGQIK
jgi:general secretion pathway protein C